MAVSVGQGDVTGLSITSEYIYCLLHSDVPDTHGCRPVHTLYFFDCRMITIRLQPQTSPIPDRAQNPRTAATEAGTSAHIGVEKAAADRDHWLYSRLGTPLHCLSKAPDLSEPATFDCRTAVFFFSAGCSSRPLFRSRIYLDDERREGPGNAGEDWLVHWFQEYWSCLRWTLPLRVFLWIL